MLEEYIKDLDSSISIEKGIYPDNFEIKTRTVVGGYPYGIAPYIYNPVMSLDFLTGFIQYENAIGSFLFVENSEHFGTGFIPIL